MHLPTLRQFVHILNTDPKETEAFKRGIVDEHGFLLEDSRQSLNNLNDDEVTYGHLLAWNLRRMLNIAGTEKGLNEEILMREFKTLDEATVTGIQTGTAGPPTWYPLDKKRPNHTVNINSDLMNSFRRYLRDAKNKEKWYNEFKRSDLLGYMANEMCPNKFSAANKAYDEITQANNSLGPCNLVMQVEKFKNKLYMKS